MGVYGGIEAGGTKIVCAVGTAPDDIRAEERFATSVPEETIPRAVRFFQEHVADGELDAVGIASFGPVDPDPASPTWGHITTTPKPGWAHIDFAGQVQHALGVPVGFDTDVNAAALGEHRWGAARGLHTFIYLTVGTGIGGGGMVEGRLLHGMMHPEMGHIRIPHDLGEDPYAGQCVYHGDCLEGLACGPALEGRWGQRGETLPPDHPAWELEARYLAYGVVNYTLTLAPQRVIMGGGVMAQAHLFSQIRANVRALLNDYLQVPQIARELDRFVVPPELGGRAGVLGAIALAERAALGHP